MKKLLLLCLCGLITFCLHAQKTKIKQTAPRETSSDFCQTLAKIMDHASTDFEKINTGKGQVDEDHIDDPDYITLDAFVYKASLNFPEATLSSVMVAFLGDPAFYSAYFGIYENQKTALKKIDSLKNLLLGCLSNYKIKKESPSKKNLISYLFTEKRTDKNAPQQLNIYIDKKTGYADGKNKIRFKVWLTIKGLAVK